MLHLPASGKNWMPPACRNERMSPFLPARPLAKEGNCVVGVDSVMFLSGAIGGAKWSSE